MRSTTSIIGFLLILVATSVLADSGSEPPSVRSESCLSCHPGAADAHRSHITRVDYEFVRSLNRIWLKPASSPSGFGATIADDLLLNGRVECTSCHFTHAQESDNKLRLRVPGGASFTFEGGAVDTKLCLACHVLD